MHYKKDPNYKLLKSGRDRKLYRKGYTQVVPAQQRIDKMYNGPFRTFFGPNAIAQADADSEGFSKEVRRLFDQQKMVRKLAKNAV